MVILYEPDGTIETRPGESIGQDGLFFRIYDGRGKEISLAQREFYIRAETDDGRYRLAGLARQR